MWELSTILAAHPSCPVCGAAERRPCAAAPRPPSPYTETLAAAVGMTGEAVLAAMPLWTCRRCRTKWHDPWLTPEAAAWLYATGRPLHRYGRCRHTEGRAHRGFEELLLPFSRQGETVDIVLGRIVHIAL